MHELRQQGSIRLLTNSVQGQRKIENYRKPLDAIQKNVGCIPLAIIIMMTANGLPLTFSERHSKFFIISDRYRFIEFAEVHTDIP